MEIHRIVFAETTFFHTFAAENRQKSVIMTLFIQLIAALLPAILLFLYIWKKDANPEPTRLLLKAVLWGALIGIPCCFIEMFISAFISEDTTSIMGAAIDSFVVAALPEESCKLLVLWWILRKNPYYDEHYDGIVYAVCVGLGFAGFENIFYIIDDDTWVETALFRAFLAVPGHYAFAVLMGYYYSVYHFTDHSTSTKYKILWVPVVAHGIYDTLCESASIDESMAAICMLVLIFFCIRMHKFAKKRLVAMVEKDKAGDTTMV